HWSENVGCRSGKVRCHPRFLNYHRTSILEWSDRAAKVPPALRMRTMPTGRTEGIRNGIDDRTDLPVWPRGPGAVRHYTTELRTSWGDGQIELRETRAERFVCSL